MTPFSQLPATSTSVGQYFQKNNSKQLLKTFWLIAAALLYQELFRSPTDSNLSNISAALITVSALWPMYLWCAEKIRGMPVFPFYAISYIWTFALPLVSNHPEVLTYTPRARLVASLTISGFLLIGTQVWSNTVNKPRLTPSYYKTLEENKGDIFFITILALSVLFFTGSTSGWLSLGGTLFSSIRNATLGLAVLASFVLSYRLGKGELSSRNAILFAALLLSYMLASSIGLLLIGAASTLLISVIAFTIGSRKVPIIAILIAFACLSLLHSGKSDMRSKYWSIGIPAMQLWDYPAYYSEWIDYGLKNYAQEEDEFAAETEEPVSFSERASLMQMLLLAQSKSPSELPFMYGDTYSILPQVIVPRVLNSSKIRTTEGTHRLSVYYGLQTYEETMTTSISWGLLAESYANFGLIGCGGLGVVLGWLYGTIGSLSIDAPILSAQSLFSILVMTFAMQTEWTASVYVAAAFQSSVVVGVIVVVFMKNEWQPIYQNSSAEAQDYDHT